MLNFRQARVTLSVASFVEGVDAAMLQRSGLRVSKSKMGKI